MPSITGSPHVPPMPEHVTRDDMVAYGATNKPTAKDGRLLHSCADRMWEWAKRIEDPATRTRLKELASEVHLLAEGGISK